MLCAAWSDSKADSNKRFYSSQLVRERFVPQDALAAIRLGTLSDCPAIGDAMITSTRKVVAVREGEVI